MIENIDPAAILQVIGLCLCVPVIAASVTLVILAVLNRRRMIRNDRDTWLRW